MKVRYNKLWKILIDNHMNKTDLKKATGISSSSLAKLSKDEVVSTEILLKICKVLKCDIGDIMEALESNED